MNTGVFVLSPADQVPNVNNMSIGCFELLMCYFMHAFNQSLQVHVCLDNLDLHNPESAMTRTTFGRQSPCRLNCV